MVDAKTSGYRGGSRAASNRKLMPGQVQEIRHLLAQGKHNNAEIGRIYGVSSHTVRAIKTGYNYRDVE